MAALSSLAALAGCAAPAPVFPPVTPPIVWPSPPDMPRIRYIGELRGEASLHRRPSGWEAIQAVLTGPRRMTAFVQPLAVAARGPRVAVTDPGAAGGAAIHVLDVETREFTTLRTPEMTWPIDVAFVMDRIAVADAQAACVFVFDPASSAVRVIGRSRLVRPVGVAWDSTAQRLWVLDAGAHAIVPFTLAGEAGEQLGTRGASAGEFNFPGGIAIQPGQPAPRLAVADSMNFRVQVIPTDASDPLAFGEKGDAAGNMAFPRDVAIDSDGHIYVLDKHFENVQVFDQEGRLLLAFGGEGNGPGQFNLPAGLTIDEHDRLWIADTHNQRVQVLQYLKEQP
jgi:DNA-binding beta-propeller fold protein YncE